MRSATHLFRVLFLCGILVNGLLLPSQTAFADTGISLNLFYRELAPYGRWFDHHTYGRVWRPNGVSKNWRPYTEGHWINTARYGWYWQSDWDWGWAPFHYGRWAYDTVAGWVWIPGTVWAPAWVSWQYNNGYSAWAPLPPEIYWQPQSGLSFSYSNAYSIPSNSWVVVPQRRFTHRHINRFVLPPHENSQHINSVNNTYNNLALNNNRIVNLGVPVTQLEREQNLRVQTISGHETEALIAHQIRGARGAMNTMAPGTQPMSQAEAERERELAERIMRETQNQAGATHPHGFDHRGNVAVPAAIPAMVAPQFDQQRPDDQRRFMQQQQMEAQQQSLQQQQWERQQQMEQARQMQGWQQQEEQQRQAALQQQQEMQQQAERQRVIENQQQQFEQQRQMELQQQQVQQAQQEQIRQQQEMQQQVERQRQIENQRQQVEQQRQMELQQQQAQQAQQEQMRQQQEMQQQVERQRQMESQQQQAQQEQMRQQQAMQQQAEQQRQMEAQQQSVQQQMEMQQQVQRQEIERVKRLKEQEGQPQTRF